MKNRSELLTEQRLASSSQLDTMSLHDAIALMNQQDQLAQRAVEAEAASVAKAIELVVAAFKQNGRLIYVGAGTSGRLGVLDASECPPTFRSDPAMVQAIIAGGPEAMFRAKEGAEDRADEGGNAIDDMHVSSNDVVMGIAAGGTTPFVHGALRRAIERNAKTIFLSCVQPVPNEPPVNVVIRPLTGPEVLTGSTRLKAGTATKLILNQITTLAMVQLGKCYENLMVDLRATNDKLKDRAIRIICTLTDATAEQAVELLSQSNGHVKCAILMHRRQLSAVQADQLLADCQGQLRPALTAVHETK
jgi:N-acetylmuramic acid 6-phosphate etherase